MNHHKAMQASRDRVFADYQMRIGLGRRRISKVVKVLDAKRAPDWVRQLVRTLSRSHSVSIQGHPASSAGTCSTR